MCPLGLSSTSLYFDWYWFSGVWSPSVAKRSFLDEKLRLRLSVHIRTNAYMLLLRILLSVI